MNNKDNRPIYTEKHDIASQQEYIRSVMKLTRESAITQPIAFKIESALDEILNKEYSPDKCLIWKCTSCGCETNDGNFCKNCGVKRQ